MSLTNKRNMRSRSGCVRCKQKRVSCDRAKPTCTRCSQKGVHCQYVFELKFKEDLLSKGAVFGREGVWNKQKSGVKSHELSSLVKTEYFICPMNNSGSFHFINTIYDDIIYKNPQIHSYTSNSYIDLIDDNHETSYALAYYLEYVSPIFNPTNFKSILNNQVRKGLDFGSLIEYSNSSSHILYLLLSVGSAYLTKASSTEFWLNKSQMYKKLALNVFNEKFKQLGLIKSTQNGLVCDLLLSTLLLCLFDLANDCNDNWSNHFKMAKYLSNQFNEIPKTDFQEKVFEFVFDFFCYQEVMGRTACCKNGLFEFGDDDELINWMGCNKILINVISEITYLNKEKKNMFMPQFNEKLKKLKQRLLLVEAYSFDLNSINEINREEICFIISCESKRLATELYFKCSLQDKSPSDKDISDIVLKLANFLKFVIVENGYFWSFQLWTIFMFSVEIDPISVDNESLRSLVLDLLGYLELNNLGNVNKIREIILGIWKKRDLEMDSIANDCNDWDTFVSNESWNISLG